ncbi:hypothetical protein OBBRIDRAFT_799671 [Obba rivulosa]|uniref:Uncharacterized protein n=1 Tax=Obba rivulosa TaxID=1052685 RepID=A0A8E2AKS5_9APHY|nr:hypothetical protein OBBRIDRAFT_799671 [Obba rivulosa]
MSFRDGHLIGSSSSSSKRVYAHEIAACTAAWSPFSIRASPPDSSRSGKGAMACVSDSHVSTLPIYPRCQFVLCVVTRLGCVSVLCGVAEATSIVCRPQCEPGPAAGKGGEVGRRVGLVRMRSREGIRDGLDAAELTELQHSSEVHVGVSLVRGLRKFASYESVRISSSILESVLTRKLRLAGVLGLVLSALSIEVVAREERKK